MVSKLRKRFQILLKSFTVELHAKPYSKKRTAECEDVRLIGPQAIRLSGRVFRLRFNEEANLSSKCLTIAIKKLISVATTYF